MEAPTLRLCHLYPSLLNIAGDRGNVFAIQRRCAWRGIRTEVCDVGVGERPDFTAFDVILFHGGQDKEMDVAARDLALKAASLTAAVESDVVVLAVCAGFQLMGRYYQPFKGPRLEGVGAIDTYTEAGQTRFMNHAVTACDFAHDGAKTLVGFENHSGRTYLGPAAKPLGTVVVGHGNNGEDGTEGAAQGRVVGTYSHGSCLPKNPWLADRLLAWALERRHGAVSLRPLDDAEERAANEQAAAVARARP